VYKDVDLSKGESRTSEFLAMSPIGKIPVFKDGDFVFIER
jgi:glutathione S-transferase